jgi:putative component of membrane protein insertase Oxa1/YidC/SpoIIIJ protein YidD
VQQRGFVLGSILTGWRILRCNPLSRGGLDPVTPGSGLFIVRDNGFVVPRPRASKR